MNVLNIEHIHKIYGEKVIFDDVSLGIHQGDKIGIIGVNGTGKTTLLKIIAGLEETDEGEIIRGNGIRVSYLPQNPEFSGNPAILSDVMEGKVVGGVPAKVIGEFDELAKKRKLWMNSVVLKSNSKEKIRLL